MPPSIPRDPNAPHRQPYKPPPQPTGRRMVMFKDGVEAAEGAKLLSSLAEQPVVRGAEMGSLSASLRTAAASDSIVLLERLGMAVVGGGLQQTAALAGVLQAREEVEDTRPEFWMFALAPPPPPPPWSDTAASTWGLEATGAQASHYDGSGVRIAVLDTGLDLGHPDFVGRRIISASFVTGETVDDAQGHGTHTAGTAASSGGGGNIPRYGVAPKADLFIGKVLNNLGAGRELDIQAGIEWALEQDCHVVSMSLGRGTAPEEQPDPIYERIAKRALDAGTLIVAAAGNDSDRRYGHVAPVGCPANSPSIMAVAAVGADEAVSYFSSGGVGVSPVDICAPGDGVFSSVPRPLLYTRLAGTSMACPHVAGVAALWAQKEGKRGQALWDSIVSHAAAIPKGSKADYGAGLVQAP